jgi:hypothetical protein
MMEAARTYETSVDIDLTTRQYIPDDSELHTRRRENLKSHTATNIVARLATVRLYLWESVATPRGFSSVATLFP